MNATPAQRLAAGRSTQQSRPAALRADDFNGFIRQRACAWLGLIEAATGKTVAGRDNEETIEAFGACLAAQG